VPGAAFAGPAAQKKSLHASERDTPRVRRLRLRRQWLEEAKQVPAKKLVFVDESGANTAMTRTRGRAPRGQRVPGAVPNGHWSTLTMIGALRLSGLAAAATVDAPTDGPIFHSFVTEGLVPTLRRGDVVVWDGLAPHKAAGVADAVEAAGARLLPLPLPPYSPDFAPIEPMWSKVKQKLRDAEARTATALGDAAEAFASVTAADARGWFGECGYCAH
jgi:transposase